MYFFSKIYQWFKLSAGGVGGVYGVVQLAKGIMLGSGTGGILLIIGGALYVILSAFVMFDGSKVLQDIKKQVRLLEDKIKDFQTENDRLKVNVDELEQTKKDFIKENNKLSKLLKKGSDQIDKLEITKNSYMLENNKLKKLIEDSQHQLDTLCEENAEFKSSLDALSDARLQFVEENTKLKDLLMKAQCHIETLSKLKNDYEARAKEYEELLVEHQKQLTEQQSTNFELSKTIEDQKEQLEIMKSQINKLKELYDDTKKLLAKLVTAGDMFSQFEESVQNLGNTEHDLNNTSYVIRNLIDVLSNKNFESLDTNADGVIDQDEWGLAIHK